MKTQTGLLIATAIACTFSISPGVFAKTAKDCTAEWRADKAGMKARGVTEKAYVEQCKGGAEPSAAAPASSPRQTTATGSKTAKECTAEWRDVAPEPVRANRNGSGASPCTAKTRSHDNNRGAGPGSGAATCHAPRQRNT